LDSAYSRALQAELQCRKFLVDSERQVNIWYTTSTGQLHLVAPDRCDLFVRPDGQSPIVIELKVRKANPSDKAQLRRYMIGFKRELSKEVVGVLVYFLATGAHIEWVGE
jgi:RecB family endonuclease NucS